jgi:hypothetical protein
MSTLSDRLKILVASHVSEYRRFKQLEVCTGLAAESWKSWFHGRQRPTVEMIESACAQWPQHAFWLATGRADSKHGHTPPPGVCASEIERTSVVTFA